MDYISEISKVLAGMDDSREVKKFLNELLTMSELKNVELRWALLGQLADGVPQRDIAANLGISLCKITRGSKILKDGNSQLARIFLEKGVKDERKTKK